MNKRNIVAYVWGVVSIIAYLVAVFVCGLDSLMVIFAFVVYCVVSAFIIVIVT